MQPQSITREGTVAQGILRSRSAEEEEFRGGVSEGDRDYIFGLVYYMADSDYLIASLCELRFLDMLEILVQFLPPFWTLWFGVHDYRFVVYREIGSIPEEQFLGNGTVFSD
jgi:hypothetical protein